MVMQTKPLRRSALRLAVLAAAAVLGLFSSFLLPSSASETSAANTAALLLPDLTTLLPDSIAIVSVKVRGNLERRLRFDNEIVNQGAGPLEMFPTTEGCATNARNLRLVRQNVYQDTVANSTFDRGGDTIGEVHDVGCSVFHPQHHHWHIENFASYELKSGATTVASSTKVSFCVIDVQHVQSLPGSPSSPYYGNCGRNDTTGLSVGWSDEYQSTLAGQYIVINNVTDGSYCLVSTADPLNHIRESNDANNSAGVSVQIIGSTVTRGGSC
jgi:Lysyl oxidase